MLELVTVDIKRFKDKIYPEYLKLFPDSERKSYKQLETAFKKAILQIIEITSGENFVGFILANSLDKNGYLQVDYFAILPEFQGRGYGTQAINKLKQISNKYKGIFIEVEKLGLGKDKKENDLRQRRMQFYKKLGFIELNSDFILYKVVYTPLLLPIINKIESEDKIIIDIFKIYYATIGGSRVEKNCSVIRR